MSNPYIAYEHFTDEKMLPHRMREISDSLKRTKPDHRVEFETKDIGNDEHILQYMIWNSGK